MEKMPPNRSTLRKATIAMKWPDDHFESLWVRRMRGAEYEVRNIPYFAYNISLGDVVECRPDGDGIGLFVKRVIRKSGNRTVRVSFKPFRRGMHPEARKLWRYLQLHRLGADNGSIKLTLFAINAPSLAKYNQLVKRLKRIPKSAKMIWEDGDPQPGVHFDGSDKAASGVWHASK